VPLGCAPEPWALAAPPASAAARMAALGVGRWGGVRTAHGRKAHESFETAGPLGRLKVRTRYLMSHILSARLSNLLSITVISEIRYY